MERRPVLYLDLDDTIISWEGGTPHAAAGATEFIDWALDHVEVRWLTTWCPGGDMPPGLLDDLVRMLDLPRCRLESIRGFEWESGGSKLNGLAWLEHLVLDRPFAWIEDDYGFTERERSFLIRHGLIESYFHCNVTEKPDALIRAHRALRGWLERVSTPPRTSGIATP